MTDEEQLRALLSQAAELPDDLMPPVERLVRLGRRRRSVRSGFRTLTIGVIAVAAVATPPVIGSIEAGRTAPGLSQPRPSIGTTHPLSVGSRSPGSRPAGSSSPNPGPLQPPDLSSPGWSALPASPLGARQPDILTWAGKYLLEIGGAVGGKPSKTGAMFDPASGAWHLMAPVPATVNVADSAFVWTGHELFVTDARFPRPRCQSLSPGARSSACLPSAGLFDPATNRWSTTPLPRPLDEMPPMVATWTGREVVLAGVSYGNPRLEVAAFDPTANRWTMITPTLPAGHSPIGATVVATSSRILLWVRWSHSAHGRHPRTRAGTDVLALSSNDSEAGARDWHDVTDGWPQRRSLPTPVFTGTEILVPPSQSLCSAVLCRSITVYPGVFADPVTLRRSAIPFSPIDSVEPAYIPAGPARPAILEINLQQGVTLRSGQHIRPDEIVEYDQASGRWRQLPAPPGRPFAAGAVWTGRELLLLTDRGALLRLHP